uniref:Uncharacterized protein n=1 Tax=Fagus sylvatica TaxID=28930 RepID=A0A2N9IMW4_FAGSY
MKDRAETHDRGEETHKGQRRRRQAERGAPAPFVSRVSLVLCEIPSPSVGFAAPAWLEVCFVIGCELGVSLVAQIC